MSAAPSVSEIESLIAFIGWITLSGASLLWLADVTRGRDSPRRTRPPRSAQEITGPRRSPQLTACELPAAQGYRGAAPVLTVKRPSEVERGPETTIVAKDAPAGDTVAAKKRGEETTALPSISLLGPLTVTGAKQSRGLRSATKELLVYLALHADGATADEMIEAIWPETDPRRARPRLWQAVAQARRILGNALIRQQDRYHLDRKRVTIDVDTLADVRAQENQAVGLERREQLDRALDLYRGEPLAGVDYPWAEPEIRRLRADYVELLEHAADARLDAGDPPAALEAAERGLAIDALDEKLWRLAMRAETALGMRESVSRRYTDLRRILDDRLGLEPDNDTRTLYRDLLGQR
jgi:DNA-binding SARP family transcriptional activator